MIDLQAVGFKVPPILPQHKDEAVLSEYFPRILIMLVRTLST